uniref:6-pyruvoyltetrahydropterin synthase n=1 Tax=Craspedostauros australis TaxID=1486917 RepID=A0A7R9WRW2_9STRA|mmetsp:Transcript_17077/g.47301  ORF Transcript_17077/g.47301 Transcript_17077/m.47301 type:complete len:177 (+) Transcript_17077:373-903(+)
MTKTILPNAASILTFVITFCWLCTGTLCVSAPGNMPFTLGVRDSLMIAHSFHQHPSFGPAGKMHGATYTCDVEFQTDSLHPETNWVIDIGKASEIVSDVLKRYNLQNLDEVFPDKTMTTTEFMARQIHDDIQARLATDCADFQGQVCVKLWESHKAWASYTGMRKISEFACSDAMK